MMGQLNDSSMSPPSIYQPMGLATMDTSYKIDEGYSEETRSQDDLDSPMRLEPNTELLPSTMRLAMDSIMSLNEDEKSGKFHQVCIIFTC